MANLWEYYGFEIRIEGVPIPTMAEPGEGAGD